MKQERIRVTPLQPFFYEENDKELKQVRFIDLWPNDFKVREIECVTYAKLRLTNRTAVWIPIQEPLEVCEKLLRVRTASEE